MSLQVHIVFNVQCLFFLLSLRLSMNAGDVSGTVALDSVSSVTFTQDTDGTIILHCSQNGQFVCVFAWGGGGKRKDRSLRCLILWRDF